MGERLGILGCNKQAGDAVLDQLRNRRDARGDNSNLLALGFHQDVRQAVAIARTMLSQAKIVLMDEPTAAISVRQVAQVLALIERMKAQGVAVMLISHRMPDVFAVCDRIVVMRRGSKVADKRTPETSPEEITGLITGAIRAA